MHRLWHTTIYLNWYKRTFAACVTEYTNFTKGSKNVLVYAVVVNVLREWKKK